jgi:23S rRNA pseudouridine1911/1915/1917 synthase
MDVSVLYEDEHILAIYKPAGLIVHGDGRSQEPTLVDWLLEHYPTIRPVGEPFQPAPGNLIERPGIVHRIDRETSGVLLVAKTQAAFLHLKQQFQSHTIEKRYNAFLYGVPKMHEGTIMAAIGKSKRDFRRFATALDARGAMREAETYYRVLEISEKYCFVEAKPKTGRTHQIRVHLHSIGHPVVGDRLYAGGRENTLGFERLALHARSISFYGLDNSRLTIEAGLPLDFEQGLAFLRGASR